MYCFLFLNDTATTEIYTYCHTHSLHDALPISPQPGYGGGQPQGTSVMAIISLVTGILGLCCAGWFIFSIAAVVLGYLGKKETAAGKKDRKSTRLNSSH